MSSDFIDRDIVSLSRCFVLGADRLNNQLVFDGFEVERLAQRRLLLQHLKHELERAFYRGLKLGFLRSKSFF